MRRGGSSDIVTHRGAAGGPACGVRPTGWALVGIHGDHLLLRRVPAPGGSVSVGSVRRVRRERIWPQGPAAPASKAAAGAQRLAAALPGRAVARPPGPPAPQPARLAPR